MSENSNRVKKHREKREAGGGTRMDVKLRPGNKAKLAELARTDGVSPTEWINRRIEYRSRGDE